MAARFAAAVDSTVAVVALMGEAASTAAADTVGAGMVAADTGKLVRSLI
jgi:hypothetical protein